MAVLALAFYLDYNREWKPYEDAYFKQFPRKDSATGQKIIPIQQIYQLQPRNAQEVERCITCHVPDIALIGGKEAARRIPAIKAPKDRNPQAHPDRITDDMVRIYGLPSQYANTPIDVTGCMVCHNGQGLATEREGAHRNLIVNIFDVVDRGSVVFKSSCAACHGNAGEGGIGPPLADQHRLGFFNDDYYYDCVFYGNLSEHHLKTKMPAWGEKKLFGASSNEKVSLMVHWIRHYQKPLTFTAQ
jgi:mono/diheme cytochrome c family protein